jgi:hypothetical protein
LACSITAGACCVGMRTRVCGRGGSVSGLSASSSSFGLGILAAQVSLRYFFYSRKGVCRDSLEAMLMARRTLCQFERTAATAGTCQYEPVGHIGRQNTPSVPLDSVCSLSASICIWSARPPLSACRSLRLASSAFFSAMRASSTGDCCAAPPSDWLRRCDGSGRP